jgi:hypothetical protein
MQHRTAVVAAEKSPKGLFKTAAEDHGRPGLANVSQGSAQKIKQRTREIRVCSSAKDVLKPCCRKPLKR